MDAIPLQCDETDRRVDGHIHLDTFIDQPFKAPSGILETLKPAWLNFSENPRHMELRGGERAASSVTVLLIKRTSFTFSWIFYSCLNGSDPALTLGWQVSTALTSGDWSKFKESGGPRPRPPETTLNEFTSGPSSLSSEVKRNTFTVHTFEQVETKDPFFNLIFYALTERVFYGWGNIRLELSYWIQITNSKPVNSYYLSKIGKSLNRI